MTDNTKPATPELPFSRMDKFLGVATALLGGGGFAFSAIDLIAKVGNATQAPLAVTLGTSALAIAFSVVSGIEIGKRVEVGNYYFRNQNEQAKLSDGAAPKAAL